MQSKSSKIPEYFYGRELHFPGIYAIICVQTGKRYIGSAVDVFNRWRGHFYHLEKGNHHCSHLQRSWSKRGQSAFLFTLLEQVDDLQNLRDREQFHIDAVHVNSRYNAAPTAGSLLGFKQSPEVIERMRVSATGFRHSEETKQRARDRTKGVITRPAGWTMTDEQKEKLSAAKRGKPLHPHFVEKARIAATGRAVSAEHRKRLAEFHRKHTVEEVEQMRAMYKQGLSCPEIAKILGAERKTVGRAIRGVSPYDYGEPVPAVTRRPNKAKGKPGKPWTDEMKAKSSASHMGKTVPPEIRAKMSDGKFKSWEAKKAAGERAIQDERTGRFTSKH